MHDSFMPHKQPHRTVENVQNFNTAIFDVEPPDPTTVNRGDEWATPWPIDPPLL